MGAAVCFSGGKDSALAALLLAEFYDVTCVVATFGLTDDADHAIESARAIDFPVETVDLDPAVAREASARMVDDGYPRNAIQQVHEHVLEIVAGTRFETVADGTRRDDRVPTLSRAQARSLEDRHGVDYVRPLAGFGRGAVDRLADATLDVETGPSETLPTGDYEAELRAYCRREHGAGAVARVFPDHEQSRVVGRRE